jgi:hypothetical protein
MEWMNKKWKVLFNDKKVKIGRVRHIAGHKKPEVESRYSCTLSLTSAPDEVGGQHRAPVT